MESWFLGTAGSVAIVIGLALVIFNRQYTKLTRPTMDRTALWRQVKRMHLFTPNTSGRTPMVTIIGIGCVVVGVAFLLVEVGVLPEYGDRRLCVSPIEV